MAKSISIVDARRDLGRIADEVRRTGQAVVLTRRGRPVARLAPHPPSSAKPVSAGTAPLQVCAGASSCSALPTSSFRPSESSGTSFAVSLERRSARLERSPRPRRA